MQQLTQNANRATSDRWQHRSDSDQENGNLKANLQNQWGARKLSQEQRQAQTKSQLAPTNSARTNGGQSQSIASTIQTQTLLVSESNCSLAQENQIHANIEVVKTSVYQCQHGKTHQKLVINSYDCSSSNILCGDAHLVNCNSCGAYFPKSGSAAIRALKRHTQLNKLYTSDILRSMYSQCQQRSGKPEHATKITSSYQEVRNLIIDWMAEVAETLRLDIQKSAYHAILLLDRFLSNQIKFYKKEMDQSLIMLQALCCLFIAAKNYEKDPNVPSSRKFLRQLPGYKPTQAEQKNDQQAYQHSLGMLTGKDEVQGFNSKKNELVSQEVLILKEIGFDMDGFPSFFDVIEIFMAQGILFTSDQHFSSPVQDERCVNLIEKYIEFFVLLSLQDHKLVNTNQYLIACSITSAARRQCNINPAWPQELEQLTGLQHSHFSNIEKRLISKFEQQYNAKNKIKIEGIKASLPLLKQSTSSQLQLPEQKQQNAAAVKKYGSQERDQQEAAPRLGNIKVQEAPQLNNQNFTQSTQSQPQTQNQAATNPSASNGAPGAAAQHQREVSKSNLLGRHQDSSLFRNMVQENKQKYDQKLQNEKQETGPADTLDQRQQQMRIKYGSNKTQQKYYSSRMQMLDPNSKHNQSNPSNMQNQQFMAVSAEQPQHMRQLQSSQQENPGLHRTNSQTSMVSSQVNGSNSSIIRMKHQEIYNPNSQSKSMVQRQKSLVVGSSNEDNNALINRANNLLQQKQMPPHPEFVVGSSSTKAADRPSSNPTGLLTNSSTQHKFISGSIQKMGGKHQQLYSRELSNAKILAGGVRGSSQTSNSSMGGGNTTASTGQGRFGAKLSHQGSDNKSLVRQALKNQKRTHKINPDAQNSQLRQVGGGGSSNNGSNQGSVSAVQRIQRLRINSNNKVRPQMESSDGLKTGPAQMASMANQQQQPQFIRAGQNLPRVSNQKLAINNPRSLSNSGQKILTGVVGNVSNTQLIKNKIKISKVTARDNSYTSQNSGHSHGSANMMKFSQGVMAINSVNAQHLRSYNDTGPSRQQLQVPNQPPTIQLSDGQAPQEPSHLKHRRHSNSNAFKSLDSFPHPQPNLQPQAVGQASSSHRQQYQ